jgi:hypothetical protein
MALMGYGLPAADLAAKIAQPPANGYLYLPVDKVMS